MEKELTGQERRNKMINILENSNLPISGTELGKRVGVSRQVIVQDIAFLRMQGHDITSTARGYILENIKEADGVSRIIKVCHTTEQVAEELNLIVDNIGNIGHQHLCIIADLIDTKGIINNAHLDNGCRVVGVTKVHSEITLLLRP